MLRHRAATKKDIKVVMAKLSDISRSELSAAGWDVAGASALMMKQLNTDEGIVFLDRATPIAVMFFEPTEGKETTMFMATEGFFGTRIGPTLYLRKLLKNRLIGRPLVAIESTTYSAHPEVIRWYGKLGGQLMNDSNGVRCFRMGTLSAQEGD